MRGRKPLEYSRCDVAVHFHEIDVGAILVDGSGEIGAVDQPQTVFAIFRGEFVRIHSTLA